MDIDKENLAPSLGQPFQANADVDNTMKELRRENDLLKIELKKLNDTLQQHACDTSEIYSHFAKQQVLFEAMLEDLTCLISSMPSADGDQLLEQTHKQPRSVLIDIRDEITTLNEIYAEMVKKDIFQRQILKC